MEVENVRKKDWTISLNLPLIAGETRREHDQMVAALTASILVAKPSFLYPRLQIEIRQPVIGRVANAVIRLCQYGIPECKLRTLFPDQPNLIDDEDASHIIYRYGIGKVVEQETVMCRDLILGDELMIHTVVMVFDKFCVETNEWRKSAVLPSPPILALVPDTGSEIAAI